jgi:hypothetical protein
MGYMSLIAECVRCNRVFTCNPDLVPSVRINGVKEPICKDCIEPINKLRAKLGNELIKPLPGAYDVEETDDY